MINKNDIKSGLYGFVIGDAMGVPIEFTNRNNNKHKMLKEMIGYGSHHVPEGTWSDDSSMTLATMDSIQEKCGIDYDDVMKKFLDWYISASYTATDVVFDIGIATSKALRNYSSSSIPATSCGGNSFYDNGNGSLMRMLPVSLYLETLNLTDEERISVICNMSSLTHGHEISKLGCTIYDRFIHELLSTKDKQKAYDNCCAFDYSKYFTEKSIKEYERILSGKINKLNVNDISSSGYVINTLEASLWSILTTSSYEASIIRAINLGNDTDTVGAITGSMSGLLYGYENIPKRWLEKLRKKEFLDDMIDKFNYNIVESNHISKSL